MELIVQKRDKFRRQVKALRKEGFIPAELYGRGIENIHLTVSKKDFQKVFTQAGESTMINLIIDGGKRQVLIYGVGNHPVTDEVLSVDFYQVRLDEKITVDVPLEFVGEALGVKAGGILVKALKEIEIKTLPGSIPHSLEVDLAKLSEIGQSIYVKDLNIPQGVEVLVEPEMVIASITEPVTEEQEAAMAQETDVSEIKIEGEEKKEEKAAAAEGGEPRPETSGREEKPPAAKAK